MKTIIRLVCALCALVLQTTTNAAYSKFRVAEIVREPAYAGITDPVSGDILNADLGDSMKISFTCNPGQKYWIWVTEKLDFPNWIPIKDVTPKQENIVVKNGEDIATVFVPMPFMPQFLTGNGYLRISIAEPEPHIADEDLVSIISVQGLSNEGDYYTLTFDSEYYREYLIEGAKMSNSTQWVPVNTYNGKIIQSMKVFSQGTHTTVQLANPLLPWIPKNRGWLRISKIPIMTALAAANQDIWLPVCTRDGSKDPYYVEKNLGSVIGRGKISESTASVGPSLTARDKYHVIETWGAANAKEYQIPFVVSDQRSIEIPPDNGDVHPTLKIFVALGRNTGDDPPSVMYIPGLSPNDRIDGRLQFHFETRDATVIAVATWDNPSLLQDGLSVEPFGVGVRLNYGGTYVITLQNAWHFTPMKDDMYRRWVETVTVR